MKDYWENRYKTGGNSGPGSYGYKAMYKADILNEVVKKYDIKSLIEFGCGDGNNLQYYEIDNYIGLDVSRTAIKQCIEQYKNHDNKSFLYYEPDLFKSGGLTSDLTISFEVIFHLTVGSDYKKYMNDLFKTSSKYVLIFSTNSNDMKSSYSHIKHREFTGDVPSDFKLIDTIKTPDKELLKNFFSDFYLFQRQV